MATKTIPVSVSSIRWIRGRDNKPFVAGATDYIAGGWASGEYVGYLKIDFAGVDAWNDVEVVTGAHLDLTTPPEGEDAFDGLTPGNHTKVTLTVLEENFPDNDEGSFEQDLDTGQMTRRVGDQVEGREEPGAGPGRHLERRRREREVGDLDLALGRSRIDAHERRTPSDDQRRAHPHVVVLGDEAFDLVHAGGELLHRVNLS